MGGERPGGVMKSFGLRGMTVHPWLRAERKHGEAALDRRKAEMFFLPGYAPDLNPGEFVWNCVKRNGTSKGPLRRNESLRQGARRDLAGVKQTPELVRFWWRGIYHQPQRRLAFLCASC